MKYKIRTAVPTDEGKIRELMSDSFEHDYNDLSDRTKEASQIGGTGKNED